MFVLISELNNFFVAKPPEVVDLDQSLENWEAVLLVADEIKAVFINARDFNFVSRPRAVDLIMEDQALFLARNTAGRNRSRRFLNNQLLMVLVDSLNFVQGVGAKLLAPDAFAEVLLCFLNRGVVSGSFEVTTGTPEEHGCALGVNA